MEFNMGRTPARPTGYAVKTPEITGNSREKILAGYRAKAASLVGLCYTSRGVKRFEGLGEKVDNVHIVVVNDVKHAWKLIRENQYDFLIIDGDEKNAYNYFFRRLCDEISQSQVKTSQSQVDLEKGTPVSLVGEDDGINFDSLKDFGKVHDLEVVRGRKENDVIKASLQDYLR